MNTRLNVYVIAHGDTGPRKIGMSDAPERRVVELTSPDQKRCPQCRQTLPASAFPARRDGRAKPWCHPCTRTYMRDYMRVTRGSSRIRETFGEPPKP